MKKKIIFSILLLPSILFGQVINHFDNLDSKWNVAKTYPNGNQQNPNFVETKTTIYGFQGDTIVNSEQWFKIYSTNDSLFQNDLLYRGLLRAENSKVFYLDTLNQLDAIDFNLRKGTNEYSNYHIQRAENGIREVYQTILAASTINSITESELNTLTKIYKTYTDILNYNGVKISFIQYNENVFFNLIPNDMESLKHKSVDEVDFTQIENLVAF